MGKSSCLPKSKRLPLALLRTPGVSFRAGPFRTGLLDPGPAGTHQPVGIRACTKPVEAIGHRLLFFFKTIDENAWSVRGINTETWMLKVFLASFVSEMPQSLPRAAYEVLPFLRVEQREE